MAAQSESTMTDAHAGLGQQRPSMVVVHNSPSRQHAMVLDEHPMQRAMVLDGAVMPFLSHDVISIEEVDDHRLLNVGFETESLHIHQRDVVDQGNHLSYSKFMQPCSDSMSIIH
jgi:hypothetical protein